MVDWPPAGRGRLLLTKLDVGLTAWCVRPADGNDASSLIVLMLSALNLLSYLSDYWLHAQVFEAGPHEQ